MLTKMPKVGDVVIANKKALRHNDDITVGKEYVIHLIDNDGDACFYDDDGYEDFVADDVFEGYTLKSEAPSVEPIGFIAMASVQSAESFSVPAEDIEYYGVYLSVDTEGLATLKRLASESTKQRKRSDIQSQIDALQAELNAL